ncbi:MAG: multiple sugar transport system substrate-binding protein [Parcubacteria group bacterium Gr01-1014_2]|nr:MAG: multiple sugar transport system substrate-binding protein [Parcubacteria group bacterium Gr01-1014_2]
MGGIGGQDSKRVELEFWGVFDETSAFEETIRSFRRLYPDINIRYVPFPFEEYEKAVIDALAAGRGPDIWMIQSSWLPKHKDKLAPLDQNDKDLNFKLFNFQQDFVDVVQNDLIDNGQIYALPLYVDTLALYYNKDLFNSAGISQPPKTWDEFNEAVKTLTKIDNKGNIERAGAAIGLARNVNRSTDILSLLMIQSGVGMVDRVRNEAVFANPVGFEPIGEVALEYYTDFANPLKSVYTWNDNLFYSVDAFTTERAAMMFNYSHQIQVIKSKAPRLNFEVALMPQVKDSLIRVDYANYFAPAVSTASENKEAAWKFLTFLTSRDGVLPYLRKSLRPTAKRDLIDSQKTDPDLGVFANQSLSARSWYQIDPAAIEQIFADTIENVVFRRTTIPEALRAAEDKVTVLMQRR